ncbi:uncharacterized protein LOC144149064 [Haemaphysalis longicornis]
MSWTATWSSSALAATFLLSYTSLLTSSEIFNVDAAIRRYAEKEARVRGLKLQWLDCWYNSSYMRERRVLTPYQLRARPGQFQLQEAKSETKAPTVVYTTTIRNDGKDPIISVIKESREVLETKTITTTKGLEFNISGSSTATIKGAVGIGGGFSANFMAHSTETNSNSTRKTIDIEMKVTVSPQTEVRVEWHVTEIQKNYTWTMDVFLSGYCVLYYDRTWNGERLQKVPVKFLGYDPSIPQLKLESAKHSGIVKYQTSGVMTSVETLKHRIIVTEKRLKPPKHKRTKKPNNKPGKSKS